MTTHERMTGAMYMAHCLKQEGVTKVFGQCGHTNYALIDACQRVGIDYVSFRHEQQAVHAADAYFRVSHKLAVINVHLSPGLTNALTGVATAAADGTPMVVIAGNTPSYHQAREAHQQIRLHADASQGDIFRPICKRVWRVDDAKFLPDVMPRALNLAQTGRSGAVLIDVPMDVFSQAVDAEVATLESPSGVRPRCRGAGRHRRRGRAAGHGFDARSSSRATACRLSDAVRGAGGDRAAAAGAGRDHADGQGHVPRDRSARPRDDGHLGNAAANDTTRNADVILAIGTTFGEADCSSWRPEHTFAIPPTRLIQIDIDPVEIGKSYPVDVGIVGDAKATLRALIDRLGPKSRPQIEINAQADEVAQRKRSWRAELTETQNDPATPIHPARLCARCPKRLPRTRSSSPMWAGTRTARGSSWRSSGRAPSSPAAAWRRWAFRRRQPSARSSERPTGRSSAWSATAA